MSNKWTNVAPINAERPSGLINQDQSYYDNNYNNEILMDRVSNAMNNMHNAYASSIDSYRNALDSIRESLDANRYGNVIINLPNSSTTSNRSALFKTPTVTIPSDNGDRTFGWLSRSSETGNEHGVHSTYNRNDGGGQSLGETQFHSMLGSMSDFINSTKNSNPELYTQMHSLFPQNAPTYSPEFVKFWNDNEATLKPLAREFSKNQFYTNRLGMLSPEMQARIKSDPRLGEIFYSFNVNGSQDSFKNSEITPDMPFEDIVNRVYDYRISGLNGNGPLHYYKRFSPKQRLGIRANINRERDRILSTPQY